MSYHNISDGGWEKFVVGYIEKICRLYDKTLIHSYYGHKVFDPALGDGSIQILKQHQQVILYDPKSKGEGMDPFVSNDCWNKFTGYYIVPDGSGKVEDAIVVLSETAKANNWFYPATSTAGTEGVRLKLGALLSKPTRLRAWLEVLGNS